MLIYFGEYMLGRVERMGPSCIATRFAHIYFLPTGPAGSWAVVQECGGGQFQGFRIRTYWRSVLAGYARVWSFLLAVLFGGLALSQLANPQPSAVSVLVFTLLSGALMVSGLLAHTRFGKLSLDEKGASDCLFPLGRVIGARRGSSPHAPGSHRALGQAQAPRFALPRMGRPDRLISLLSGKLAT